MHTDALPAITTIELPELDLAKQGKVRSIYDLGDTYLFVASDRISAFDCILPNGIPNKGCLLTQLSAWWFAFLKDVVPNHLITASWHEFPTSLASMAAQLQGRSMIVKKADVIPIECVARGYLIGSGWSDYEKSGSTSGVPLRAGYTLADKLDTPIFTPASKAESGHDENVSFHAAVNLVGLDMAERLRDTTLELYVRASKYAAQRGIILADTKFEFGLIDDELTLVDEALTPDSSRYWPTDTYQPGISPPSFDKQFVRDYLENQSWDKTPPAPRLPDAVVQATGEKYLEVYRRITGKDLLATA